MLQHVQDIREWPQSLCTPLIAVSVTLQTHDKDETVSRHTSSTRCLSSVLGWLTWLQLTGAKCALPEVWPPPNPDIQWWLYSVVALVLWCVIHVLSAMRNDFQIWPAQVQSGSMCFDRCCAKQGACWFQTQSWGVHRKDAKMYASTDSVTTTWCLPVANINWLSGGAFRHPWSLFQSMIDNTYCCFLLHIMFFLAGCILCKPASDHITCWSVQNSQISMLTLSFTGH